MSVNILRGRWCAAISVNNKNVWLGTFASESDARDAYAAALERHGPERFRRPPPSVDPRDRFAALLSEREPGGCVLWSGSVGRGGYGSFKINEAGRWRHVGAHRYAFFVAHGRWPAGCVLHSCGVPACVSPEHLVEGSLADRKPPPTVDPRVRFMSKLSGPTPSGCILWLGTRVRDGYGQIAIREGGKQRFFSAHRYAFFLAHGRWPAGWVLHSCDTPPCVNPEHLREGSQADNMLDACLRGRMAARLTADAVRSARARHAAGETQSALARELGVSTGAMRAAIVRRTWRHVP